MDPIEASAITLYASELIDFWNRDIIHQMYFIEIAYIKYTNKPVVTDLCIISKRWEGL